MVPKLLTGSPRRWAAVAIAALLCVTAGAAFALAGHKGTAAPAHQSLAPTPTPTESPTDPPVVALASPSPDVVVASPSAAPATAQPTHAAATSRPKASPTTPAQAALQPAQVADVPGQTVPAASPSTPAGCPSNQRLTDAEINWLLGQVSSTAGTDPQYTAGKATIDAGLSPLLGQNLCADQAQPTVTTLCADTSASTLIAAMTAKMPSFVRAYVGNPCTAKLSTVLPKLAPFAASLS